MQKLIVFNSISLDGYFTDANSDMSFAHNATPDAEFDAFTSGNASSGGVLLFGRVTYELMASFWPTPAAAESMPIVAKHMNDLPKVVFSRTMDKASWKNTKLVKDNISGEMQKMKQESGHDMVIMGSGSIVSQLAQSGLIDEYQFIMVPVALGKGRTLFEGMKEKLPMKLTKTRNFKNGNILMCYEPRT
jgi:dihydrofolate reductase